MIYNETKPRKHNTYNFPLYNLFYNIIVIYLKAFDF